MEDWLLWLILAVVFGVGEIVTLGFFLAPFAGGAAVAAVVSAAGAPFVAALAVFLVVSVVLLAALRPPIARASAASGSTARSGPRGRTWTKRPTRPARACRWSRSGAPRRS
jgi:membrane protein implicated in regulation of membrane protease activity